MTRIAIMQPYMIPYAGYFRLFAATDAFVIYDCVQFIRRGWIHRNRLTNQQGEPEWLTLPLAKAPREIKIKDLQFPKDLQERWDEQKRKFPLFSEVQHPLIKLLERPSGTPLSFIETTLKETCAALGIHYKVVRSSTLNIPEEVKGQERILAICEAFGAKQYVNASGGRELYDYESFKQRGITLSFLSDYVGGYTSILERLAKDNTADVVKEITSQLVLS